MTTMAIDELTRHDNMFGRAHPPRAQPMRWPSEFTSLGSVIITIERTFNL